MGKTAVVTGCTGGMGQILCRKLAEMGYDLGLCSNMRAELEAQAALLVQTDVKVVAECFNIYEEDRMNDFFNRVEEGIGKCGLLVNLAGVSIPTSMDTVTEKEYDTMMDVNVKGTLLASKYFARHVGLQGQIVNIGSMAAKRANGNAPLYCAAKAAVNMLSNGMQIQLAAANIRVTTLNPGGADTPFWGSRPVNRAKLLKASDVVDMILVAGGLPENVAVHAINFEAMSALR